MDDQNAPDSSEIHALLRQLAERGGSDMFFSVGAPPHVKVDGNSVALECPALGPGAVRQLAYALMNPAQIAEFERELELNLAVSVPQVGRFRANVYLQRGEVGMVVRHVKSEIPALAALGLPAPLERLALFDRGLILVVGAAGSGKSTTLAALLDHRNARKGGHILCIEDPIEFIHRHKRSLVDQREVGLDTHSFAAALRNVLREAPDVIMLGEIRDAECMQHALYYAETGHLCVATLHATSSIQAIERVVHFFPEGARKQVLADLSQNLLAVVAQRLIPGLQQRRVLAVELLLATPHLRDLVKRDELGELKDAIGNAPESGLQTFDQHLFALQQSGAISLEQALKNAESRTDLALKIRLDGNAPDADSLG
ncbi:PilT/PilU family type 4a pilus ATPase [Pseudomonas sp.]|uniref:PilT/PilU family type 4a pilus ATPase n=1 Tax=Pseudomonas sp. TaxID=306 RepID=UPI0028AF9828|nr:PilT/PilU family type 4a pilus ATPase [Pseudomonas sp.]